MFFFAFLWKLAREKRDKSFFFFFLKREDRLTVLLSFVSAACQLSVCDVGQRCLATSCLSYGSYSHHSFLHASMTSSALLHLLIICLCVSFSVRLSETLVLCLQAFFCRFVFASLNSLHSSPPTLPVQRCLPLSTITCFPFCLFVF